MRVLLDHNMPVKLRVLLPGHDVFTARQMGWAELRNGELLRNGEDAGFELMLTADQNLAYQQNLKGRKLALIVLETNRWATIRDEVALLRAAVDEAKPESFRIIPFKPLPRRRRKDTFTS